MNQELENLSAEGDFGTSPFLLMFTNRHLNSYDGPIVTIINEATGLAEICTEHLLYLYNQLYQNQIISKAFYLNRRHKIKSEVPQMANRS